MSWVRRLQALGVPRRWAIRLACEPIRMPLADSFWVSMFGLGVGFGGTFVWLGPARDSVPMALVVGVWGLFFGFARSIWLPRMPRLALCFLAWALSQQVFSWWLGLALSGLLVAYELLREGARLTLWMVAGGWVVTAGVGQLVLWWAGAPWWLAQLELAVGYVAICAGLRLLQARMWPAHPHRSTVRLQMHRDRHPRPAPPPPPGAPLMVSEEFGRRGDVVGIDEKG